MPVRQTAQEQEPTPAEERQEFDRLLAHPGIARSANLVRLLTFICEKHFEGKTEELRESSIAIHALGRRREDFDPQADPIVRVTARTLRQRLADYYEGEGRTHEVRLVLPTGQYVPRFERRRAVPTIPEPAAPASEAADAGATPDSALLGRLLSAGPRSERFPGRGRAALLLSACAVAGGLGFWAGRSTRGTTSAGTPCPCSVWGSPVWSDEFDGARGSAPDPDTWAFEVGNNAGWGNAEQEVYCAPGSSSPPPCSDTKRNSYLDGEGHLVIEARFQDGAWTSARLKTRSRREFLYGRIEARMKLPIGAGLWPAFWMLGADIEEAGWPKSGSITIAENAPLRAVSNGLPPTMVRATLHGPGYFAGTGLWQNTTLPAAGRVDDFHVYGAIWSPGMVQFYVDDPGNVFFVVTPREVPTGGEWVFDHPFFVVLSLAVGGLWPGPPDATTPDPSRVLVDYVRHYRPAPVSAPRMSASALAVRAGGVASGTVQLDAAIGTGRVVLSCAGPAGSSCTVSPAVVDFTNASAQTAALTVATGSGAGTGRVAAAPGRHTLTITATTVSGDRSTVEVPVTISRG